MDALMKKVNISMFNRKPVVVMPARVWDKMREGIEEMQENLEMYMSESYKKSIARARKDIKHGKAYSSSQARRKLNLL